ncbi:hypothetical protein PHYBOEH_010115 [Phytophthora boehmeriae]|uniref:Uncharacterized protein n=1 Tax=Phytophthora boehmeriae TaxID=109152 RepID=A0A8T1WYB4_9STRA|nr:hypothetical protein PHYBOEH_010115 [Phytophthora boehmeriae]
MEHEDVAEAKEEDDASGWLSFGFLWANEGDGGDADGGGDEDINVSLEERQRLEKKNGSLPINLSDVTSVVKTSAASRGKPHILGGSNNLVSERNRREKAETALQTTRQNLRTVAEELAPQIQQLTQAVKTLQLEKRHQLELDEASQELLEGLQNQINHVEAQQQFKCNVEDVDHKMEKAVQGLDEKSTAERDELRMLISKLQEVQDEHAAEVRLLHQELVASKEVVRHRMNTIEDAVETVRAELARSSDQHRTTAQTHVNTINELNDKLFAIDKELLKLKLALPATMKAQIPAAFTNQQSTSMVDTNRIETLERGGLGVGLKLDGLVTDLEALKADTLAYRSADRRQFDALTNRLRETAKNHHTLKKEVDGRLQEIRACCDQMAIKVPSELSRRLQQAHRAWNDDLESLKATVLNLEAYYNAQKRKKVNGNNSTADITSQELSDQVRDLQKDVSNLREKHSAHLTRIDSDLLGLYDWTRDKVASIQES